MPYGWTTKPGRAWVGWGIVLLALAPLLLLPPRAVWFTIGDSDPDFVECGSAFSPKRLETAPVEAFGVAERKNCGEVLGQERWACLGFGALGLVLLVIGVVRIRRSRARARAPGAALVG